MTPPLPRSTLFPYTTLFRSEFLQDKDSTLVILSGDVPIIRPETLASLIQQHHGQNAACTILTVELKDPTGYGRSEEHTSELQSLRHLVCRLLLEKKKQERQN